jgi:mevalonate kinase
VNPDPHAQAVGRACGKIILAGEHAVVYGHPALAGTIDRWTEVRLTPRPGPLSIEATGEIPVSALADPRLATAFKVVLSDTGYGVTISGSLWVGKGLGSSASLSTALISAWDTLHHLTPSFSQRQTRVMALENVFHGKASGIDPAVILRGGLQRFQRGAQPEVCSVRTTNPIRLVVIDSGTVGDTAKLVAGVRERRPSVDPILSEIGQLVDSIQSALDRPQVLGPLLVQNHKLLKALGVSTPVLDQRVEAAINAGALGAKLAGAGGGGVVIALVYPDTEDAVLKQAVQAGYRAFTTNLPAEYSA